MNVAIKNIVIGEGKPKICVPVVEKQYDAILNRLQELDTMDFDLIELRIDFFENVTDLHIVSQLFQDIKNLQIKKPVILTCRSLKEGGEVQLEDQEYYDLYQRAIQSEAFDIYDVELNVGTNKAIEFKTLIHEAGKLMLMSNHDFNRTPEIDTLLQRFDLMESFDADIYKIAVMPEDLRDVLTLLELTTIAKEKYHQPIVTMSMSKLGFMTRLVGEQFGSSITFGMVGEASAPGQVHYQDLQTILDIFHKSTQEA